jgi:hypothetical protein
VLALVGAVTLANGFEYTEIVNFIPPTGTQILTLTFTQLPSTSLTQAMLEVVIFSMVSSRIRRPLRGPVWEQH